MISVMAVLEFVLYVGIAWVIFKDYRHTHNVGFLILGCGMLLWPLVGNLWNLEMRVLLDRIAKGNDAGFFPLSLIKTGQVSVGSFIAFSILAYQIIQAAIILIGLRVIGRAVTLMQPRVANVNHSN